jgi:VWFA-related protein
VFSASDKVDDLARGRKGYSVQRTSQRWMVGWLILTLCFLWLPSSLAQSSQPATASQEPEVPDAPSASGPAQSLPSAPQPQFPAGKPLPSAAPPAPHQPPANQAPPGEPPFNVKTLPPGTAAAAAENSGEDLYKIVHTVNQVIVPVMVKDESGHLVPGLLPKDFEVLENGVRRKLNFFTSDPFAMSVAVVFDLGMPDVAVQKVEKTFPSLEGAFGQFDEVALYTYSSTYSKMSDFSGVGRLLDERLNSLKTVTGRNNGPPVLSGPLGPQGPTINGRSVDPGAPVIYTPPREAHVLNDAVLRAAIDLSKRPPTRRKVIFIISDGREYGSDASYSDVLRVLLSNNIMVYAIGTESAAIPGYNKISKIHLPKLGYTNILPKYVNATGGEVFNEFSTSAIESAYARAIGDARNQYTLGYITPSTPSSSYREIEVRVDRPGCRSSSERPCVNVYAKAGYYPAPPAPK